MVILTHSHPQLCVTQHADSEGALLAVKERRSLLPAAMMQNHQDLESSTGSLYDPEESRPLHEEREEEEKNADDEEKEVLMEVEQDRDGCDVIRENWPVSKSCQTCLEENSEEMSDSATVYEQISSEQQSSQKISCPLRDAEEDVMDNYKQTCGTVPRCNTDPEEIRDLCSGGRGDEEDVEDSVSFSSTQEQKNNLMGDMEDMEVDEEDAAHGGLPPSSVLDEASAFSEQFIRSLSRRSSLGADGSCDLGCPSSRSESQRSSLSCSTETREIDFRRSTPEAVKETVPDSPFRPDQRPQEKPDTLSKKDLILIHKIKRYYEHAEHQDASFAIKRRESLSYIPAGLVRNRSQQLNDLTSDEDVALLKRASSVTRPTSWAVFSLPGLEGESKPKACSSDSKLQNRDETLSDDEEFHPASDMVKVWQEMEVKRLGSSEEHRDSLDGTESSCTTTPDQEKRAEISKTSSDSGLGEPLQTLEESDEASTPSKVIHLEKSPEFQSHPNQERKIQERHKVNHSALPRIISLRSANEEDLILQDMEKMKNKVFQLARQYSQRIKNSRPVVRQRPKGTESHFMPKSLSSVMEEKPSGKEKGLPDRTLSLDLNEQDLVQDSKSASPSSSVCSPGSPQVPYFCRLDIQRPQSPVQMENFHWPDVKELCSKYSHQGQKSISHPYPMSRSFSFPDRTMNHEHERSKTSHTSSCSSSCNFTMQRATSTGPEDVLLLCRVNSLEHNLETQLPDSCWGHRTLSSENDLIRVGKGKQGLETEDSSESRVRWEAVVCGGHPSCSLEETENSQQNLVKNLREKFQHLSSYT